MPATLNLPQLAGTLQEPISDRDDPLYWAMRQENDEFLKRQRWWWEHWLRGNLVSQQQRRRQALSDQAEDRMAGFIRATFGYKVHQTTHKCPFDLWVENSAGQAARVEVKISTLGKNKGRSRYQADVRQSPVEVDLVLFVAQNGRDWVYVIPIAAIGQRRNISIWSACPASYHGRWAVYLEAWTHLHQAIANCQARAWQLSLPGVYL
jgi:hypothetical protein